MLWPFSPHPVQARVKRFFFREILRSADSGLMSGHVRTLCPTWPQEAHNRPLLATCLLALFDL